MMRIHSEEELIIIIPAKIEQDAGRRVIFGDQGGIRKGTFNVVVVVYLQKETPFQSVAQPLYSASQTKHYFSDLSPVPSHSPDHSVVIMIGG